MAMSQYSELYSFYISEDTATVYVVYVSVGVMDTWVKHKCTSSFKAHYLHSFSVY